MSSEVDAHHLISIILSSSSIERNLEWAGSSLWRFSLLEVLIQHRNRMISRGIDQSALISISWARRDRMVFTAMDGSIIIVLGVSAALHICRYCY